MGGGLGGTSCAVSMEALHFQSLWLVGVMGDELQCSTSIAAGMWSVT